MEKFQLCLPQKATPDQDSCDALKSEKEEELGYSRIVVAEGSGFRDCVVKKGQAFSSVRDREFESLVAN